MSAEHHVLIIGHGYLGQRLAQRLGHSGARVTAVARNPQPPSASDRDEGIEVIVGDVADADATAALAESRPTVTHVIHCASSGRGGADGYRSVFLDGCRNLLRAFPRVPLLFTSSTSVYAQTHGEWVEETSPAEPSRETGVILRQAEDVVLAAGGTVARLAGLYGPGRSHVLKKLLDGSATIEGNGGEGRYLNQIHIDDAASAVAWLAAHVDNGLFNVVDDHPETQRQCYSWLAPMFQRPLPPAAPADPDRKRGWTHKRVANRRLRASGWQPHHPSYRSAILGDPDLVPSILQQVSDG